MPTPIPADRDGTTAEPLPLADLLREVRDEVDRATVLGRRSAPGLEVHRVVVRIGAPAAPTVREPWAVGPAQPVLAAPAALQRAGWQIEIELGGGAPRVREAQPSPVDRLRDRNIGPAFADLGVDSLREVGDEQSAALARAGVGTIGLLAALVNDALRRFERPAEAAVHRARARLLYAWIPRLPDPGRRNPRLRGLLGLDPHDLLRRLGVTEEARALAAAQRLAAVLPQLALALTDERFGKMTYRRLRDAQDA